ncbi:MAG: Transcriptional regulator [Candidatus Roizmanbacteria bacterium GW2011_GWA2_35_19]|uniref:Transcriptional regulator n=2 Tax=Candidatus Roizmaniibacteriota TaxID=1752723 RepID=A0A0G0CCE1_9BACT|nr:MAG: Transcriptional regulator [Candidatus Roizmanbacteria bacterium GW2011_GWC2_35_12]KKP73736.1 MAG: Transcriptional regulator [Candidatus Roizmanbacteria bacterium GW2011_GWA2_35_19]
MLLHIIPSKARRKILEWFFHRPGENFYLRKIVREIDEEVNAVSRELDILTDEKLLLKERRLNKIYYSLNKNYQFYDEFTRIFAKTNIVSSLITKNLSKIGKVKFVTLSMKFPKNIIIKEDEIYLLFVGIIVVAEVESIVKEGEITFGRPINYTVMTEDEFVFRKKNNDPFIWRFLKQPKVMLVGTEDELLK